MADSTDYKALFLRAQEETKRAQEEREREAELRRQAEQREREAEQREREAEQRGARERERNRQTTFEEFIRNCHDLLSRPLRVGKPSLSTTGKLPAPIGKFCPLLFLPWTDCSTKQQEIYNSVCGYLQPVGRDAPQLFTSLVALEEYGRRFASRPISSEKDLETYERVAVEDHVHDIISELCKIPGARDEFQLGDGVQFDNHANTLDDVEEDQENRSPDLWPSIPDQFCIHRVDGNTNTLLTTVEYKPPHKLSVENLRAGLRPVKFYHKIVERDTIPTSEPEKLRYNAMRLTGSALVQEYHVMIQEGLEYSYLTTGLGLVQLQVPYDDPSILYYNLCEPNVDVDAESGDFRGPKTEIERVLCLCLMSFRSRLRDQAWRNAARANLPIWKSSFDHTRSWIPRDELQKNPPGSDYGLSDDTSSDRSSPVPPSSPSPSVYEPSSDESSGAKDRRVPTRSLAGCAPSDVVRQEDSSDSDADPAASAGRKRGFSQIASSPPTQRLTSRPQPSPQRTQDCQSRPHDNKFCTQKCLLGLKQGGTLDADCPNVELHRFGSHDNRHPINVEELVRIIKQQLDKDLDHDCTPMGTCGSYGAPFKVTCAAYGYTVVGKGTTSRLWKKVSQEAEIYRILRRVQGSAVPVFLGTVDLAYVYFLHGAGEIRHMLLMAWGGYNVGDVMSNDMRRAISRSNKKIRSLGVYHQDLRSENVLWNPELGKALIIDFHRCTLDRRPKHWRPRSLKRSLSETEESEVKRVRVA